jgi:hypothetical protein
MNVVSLLPIMRLSMGSRQKLWCIVLGLFSVLPYCEIQIKVLPS